MRILTRAMLTLALLPAICCLGCGSPRIKTRHFTSSALFRAGPGSLIPGPVVAACSANGGCAPGSASAESLLDQADRADDQGREMIARDPVAAMTWFREAAAYAMFGLAAAGPADPASPVQSRAIARHNHAVEELLRCAGSGPKKTNPVWREQLAAIGVQVRETRPERATLPCDELWIADDFKVKNMKPVRRCGLGVPLVAVSNFPNRDAIPDHYYPPKLRIPATAVFRPGGPPGPDWRAQPAVLELHDPANESAVAVAPGSTGQPLASDLTTPLAHQLVESPLAKLSFGGLLRPETFNSYLGIFMYGPYQPGKIPVLFIHGLWSSPDAWLKLANGLQADPLLRSRYQFWFAFYPTGTPILVSAGRMRESLHGLRASIDPSRGDPALDQMVVVGHSLGGVMSKQFVQSSGRSIEQIMFTRPIDSVAMSPETRSTLDRYLYFEPEPSVRRAVFLAAPHRGSNTANQLIGRLGDSLVRRPGDLTALHSEVIALNGPEVLQPAFRRRPPSSIDNLKYESPMLKTLAELPIAPGVPYHSIIANLFPEAPPRMWTDGVVSYESAHLDGAESEIMVRHSHFVNETEEATAEVRRILLLHIQNAPPSGRPASSSPGEQVHAPPTRHAARSLRGEEAMRGGACVPRMNRILGETLRPRGRLVDTVVTKQEGVPGRESSPSSASSIRVDPPPRRTTPTPGRSLNPERVIP